MPIRPCPHCSTPTPRLLETSNWAHVNYYRCPACGCVWNTPKENPEAPPNIVMPGRREQPSEPTD